MASASDALHAAARELDPSFDGIFYIQDILRNEDGSLSHVVVSSKPDNFIKIRAVYEHGRMVGFDEKALREAIKEVKSFVPPVHNYSRGERGNGLN